MSALPAPGTAARFELEREALTVAREALVEAGGNITDALYATYVTYRYRFLGWHRLLDSPPARTAEWIEALEDARTVERYVCEQWAVAILCEDEGEKP